MQTDENDTIVVSALSARTGSARCCAAWKMSTARS